MSRAYITTAHCWYCLLLATTCRFLWASTKPSCLEHVEEKSSIDKQSDSIGNQTVETGVRVRVSKSRFWCRFWSRSCVISVSTDSQKKKLKKKSRSTKTSQTPQAWWKSSESVGPVYGRCTGKRYVRLCSWICLLQTCVRHADTVTTAKTHDVGESDFFSSAAWSSQHTDNRNARLWMVSWQEKKKKEKKSKKKWTKTPDSRTGVLGPCVARDHCWALTRERKTMTKHERRIASELCAWFNYKKKKKRGQCTHSFWLILRGRCSWLSSKLRIRAIRSFSWRVADSDDSCKKTGVKKWAYMK